jgi:hypothetical protein
MFAQGVLSRDERIELIDGEIIEHQPQMMPQSVLRSRLGKWFIGQLSGGQDLFVVATVQLNDNKLVDTDVALAKKMNLERRYIRGKEVVRSIEVADTMLEYDL